MTCVNAGTSVAFISNMDAGDGVPVTGFASTRSSRMDDIAAQGESGPRTDWRELVRDLVFFPPRMPLGGRFAFRKRATERALTALAAAPEATADAPERDDPDFDGTDAAHPAWWRGFDAGTGYRARA